MRFNESDTLLILELLNRVSFSEIKQMNVQLVIDKLKNNEYIKGKILQFLFTELNKLDFTFNDARDLEVATLLKRIKFKATPR